MDQVVTYDVTDAEREAMELARQEALKPDKVKLFNFMNKLLSTPEPKLGKEAENILDWLKRELFKLDDKLREHLDKL